MSSSSEHDAVGLGEQLAAALKDLGEGSGAEYTAAQEALTEKLQEAVAAAAAVKEAAAQEAAARAAEERRKAEEEERRKAEEEKEKGLLEIHNISDHVSRVLDLVETLAKSTSNIEVNAEKDDEDSEHLRNMVSRLQKDTLRYSETLMQDLLRLDALQGDDVVRTNRKEQVKRIQDALNMVEDLRDRLGEAHKKVEIRLKSREEMSQEESEDAANAAASSEEDSEDSEDDEAGAAQAPVVKRPEDDLAYVRRQVETFPWKDLPLHVDFEVKHTANETVLEAFLPKLVRDTIKVEVQGGVLVIKGVVAPTEEDKDKIAAHCFRRKIGVARCVEGHFGRFEAPFRVRADELQLSEAYAQLRKGVLRVFVPRRRRSVPMWW